MAAWIDSIRDIWDPAPLELERADQWRLDFARPLLDRLGPRWIREDEAMRGLHYPNARAFWAEDLGLIECRPRLFRRGRWMRLTRRGWASE